MLYKDRSIRRRLMYAVMHRTGLFAYFPKSSSQTVTGKNYAPGSRGSYDDTAVTDAVFSGKSDYYRAGAITPHYTLFSSAPDASILTKLQMAGGYAFSEVSVGPPPEPTARLMEDNTPRIMEDETPRILES